MSGELSMFSLSSQLGLLTEEGSEAQGGGLVSPRLLS